MVAVTCPWCDEEEMLALAELQASEASFDCAECGTSIAFVDEPTVVFDLAA